MIKEFSWYIETDRYSNIVKQLLLPQLNICKSVVLHEMLSVTISMGKFTCLKGRAIDSAIRDYASAKEEKKEETEQNNLRETARLLCEEHAVKSGIRTDDNSYINIDTEFFDDTILDESSMNSFIIASILNIAMFKRGSNKERNKKSLLSKSAVGIYGNNWQYDRDK